MHSQALIFDLDGTLLDTLDDLARATNETLARSGYPTHATAAYRDFVGNGVQTLLQKALPEGEMARLDGAARQRLIDTFKTAYVGIRDQTTRPYPGIRELLRFLRLNRVPTAVLSNKPHEAAVRVVALSFPDHPFEVVQGALPDVPLKPNPTSALSVAERLGRKPEDIVYLGDSDVDMRTAKAAGFFAAGAAWGFRGAEELKASGADLVCTTPDALRRLLESGHKTDPLSA